MNQSRGMQALKQQISGQPSGEVNRYDFFKGKLEQSRGDLQNFLGSKAAVDRFINTCVSATVENPNLLDADMRSLLTACKKAANANLKPDGREAVLNVYNTKEKDGNGNWNWVKKVQFLPMVAGVVKMIYRGGATYVDAAAVYEHDEFDFERGDQTKLTHKPTMADEPGPIVAAYAVVKTEDGEIKREVMFARDIAKVKSKSKTSDKGPWVDWPDQMAIKSVLHRIRKQLNIDDNNLDKLLEVDNEAMGYAMNASSANSALTFDPSPNADFSGPIATDAEAVSKQGSVDGTEEHKSNDTTHPSPEKPAAMTYDEVVAMILECKSVEALDVAEGFISAVEDAEDRNVLDAKADEIRKKLTA